MNWTFTRILFQLYQLGCFRNLLNALTIFSDFTKRGGMSHIHSCHIMWWIITATELLLASGVSIKENQVILSYCKNLQHMNTHKLSPQTPFTSRFTGWPRWGSWKNYKKLIRHPKDPKVWKRWRLYWKKHHDSNLGSFLRAHIRNLLPGLPRTSFFLEHSRYSNPFLAAPKSVGLLGWIFTVPGLLRTWKASSLEEAARFWRLWESSLQR